MFKQGGMRGDGWYHNSVKTTIFNNSVNSHPHHFSEIGWQHSSQKTSYIDQATAKQFDKTIGHKAYFDNINSVQHIFQTLGRPTETRDEGMFVEAPIVTRNDVQAALSKMKALHPSAM
jgi:hypothetical protein